MTTTSIHPFFLLMSLIGIATGLYTIHQRNPAITPFLFAASLLALIVRVWLLRQDDSTDPETKLDFSQLRLQDVVRYGPWLKENLRGHDAVIDEILRDIQQGLSLAGPNRTLGAFMLAGPTGTGKTFMAELVAQALFPKNEPVILRMNQYKHPDDVFTLIGPPPGHSGYEVGGALTRPVLDDPYRVIILDEVDKCHEDVRHCLYNVLDTAHCREKSSGRNVYFNGCVFFATCNSGVDALRRVDQAQMKASAREGKIRDVLARDAGFEKAFLARFEGVFLMDELSPIHIAEVACLKLVSHWRQYGIEVTYTSPEILLEAMRKNDDFKEYGVRQLSRLIQDLTDSSIQEARKSGAGKVRLDINRTTGDIVVEQYG